MKSNNIPNPKKYGYPHNEVGLSEMRNRMRANIQEASQTQVGKTSFQTNTTLEFSPLAQERMKALEKYPQLKDKVTITNEGIVVKTNERDLKFGFNHTEGGQTFNNAHKPYSKEQLEALLQLFGSQPTPYLEILGLKNTSEYGNFNFYWSSSPHDYGRNYAWGVLLDGSGVNFVSNLRDYSFSAFSV